MDTLNSVSKLLVNFVNELLIPFTVGERVEWLQGQLKLIQSFLEVSDGKKEAITKISVSKIRELVYDAEDIMDIYSIRTAHPCRCRFLCCLFVARHDFRDLYYIGREIGQIRMKMEGITPHNRSAFEQEICSQTESLVITNIPGLQMRRRSYPESGEPDYIVGLEKDTDALLQRLIEINGRCVISIIGIAGLGKTTLALKVFNSGLVKDHFAFCAWVYVSPEYKCQDLLQQIVQQIIRDGDIRDGDVLMTEAYLKSKLKNFLKTGRYLIVLDDVWKTEVWDDLKAAFPDVGIGSKIILTTRNRTVASHADPRSLPHEPQLLNDQHSWDLLVKRVFLEESYCPPNLVRTGRAIAEKCWGLPLAITELGEVLARKDPSFGAWTQVLDLVPWHLSQDNTTFSETLAMSYGDLPYNLKQCFLYFGIFPEGFEIPVRRLSGLLVSEGLIKQHQQQLDQQQLQQQYQRSDGKSLEDIIDDYLKELIDRNMIEAVRKRPDGRPKSCRMLGVFYGLCLSKAAEVNLFHLHRSNTAPVSMSPTTRGKVHRLADHSEIIRSYPSNDPYVPHLRSFISFDYREGHVPGEEIGSFLTRHRGLAFQGFHLLRVLDLEGVFKPKLPEELGVWIYLRYLGLRRTWLDTLPESIRNLWALQILDVKHTHIKIFPCSVCCGSLANLQTLWGLFVDENTRVRDGLDMLINLRKLGLTCQLNMDQMQEVAEWIAKLDKLQSLRLTSKDKRGYPSDLILKSFSGHQDLRDIYLSGRLQNEMCSYGAIEQYQSETHEWMPMLGEAPTGNVFLQNLFQVGELRPRLTNLRLHFSGLLDDPMPTLERHGHLVYLRFLANSFVGKKMVCKSGGFPQLLVLKLWKLEELEEWEVEQGALPSLVELEIISCTKLRMLPDGLQYVKTLNTLKLTNMSDEFVAGVQAIKPKGWSLDIQPRPETEVRPSSSS